jgi:acyl-CoA thioesterase
MTVFSAIIESITAAGDGSFHVNPSDDWRQGRTLFGGLSAALCYAACERIASDLPPLRSAQIAYIGPTGGEATLRPSILRQGKSVTFVACDLIADGAVATRALFCFGGERETAHHQEAPDAPDVPPPSACQSLFGTHRPTFTQHLDQRLAAGQRPVSSAKKGEMTVWVRHEDPNPPRSLVSLIALGDALPPASMPRLTTPAAISTMTWQFDMVDPTRFDTAGYSLLRSSDEAVGHGYSTQAMGMWNERGEAVLIGRQSVAVFA